MSTRENAEEDGLPSGGTAVACEELEEMDIEPPGRSWLSACAVLAIFVKGEDFLRARAILEAETQISM
jgi:hypothetical protein